MDSIEINADKVTVYGPKVDGSYTIKLDIGEYEREKVARVIMLKTDENIKVIIKQSNLN